MTQRFSDAVARRRQWRLLALIAPAQLISWGTLYYAIAFLAGPVAEDTGWQRSDIFLAFSAGLLVAGMSAPTVGRLFSRFGGRRLLAVGSALAALSLATIGLSQSLAVFSVGWIVAGVAMALTQYEAAFATLHQLLPTQFRRTAGWITVAGGLASTLFWPLTHALAEWIGWRGAALLFAGLHIVPGLVLHWHLPDWQTDVADPGGAASAAARTRFGFEPIVVLLAAAFSALAAVTATVSAHANLIMATNEVSTGLALTFLALIGPLQVAGRLLDLSLASWIRPSTLGLAASLLLALGMFSLGYAGSELWGLVAFAVSYGLANGILTVVRGALPLELLSHHDYAKCLGRIAGPALVTRAIAPAFTALAISAVGVRAVPGALAVLAMVGFAAILGAVMLSRPNRSSARARL